ncbi:nucleotidyl transferase AbiEii/AbiGii toxin family protein [Cupriavidus sp. D39]|uniref:nucleotidyl transferase AbiEii/AbiGii toxin family protein n=1 Tax=Cupriavidus sp. D39 TaxID=2997877 RepID=UPI002271D14C|nr:nucleotidyl transferase AbiEii/AbiGii toxin family protein [Cupriavidus sp. D39]MCY0853080.1 nucleotidyl transferase AbiEii/AbiGii toxin family protein [Cupriavidus sp. D39]
MFNREHHQRIAKLLSQLDGSFLRECDTYFGGGTAIVLSPGADEYRESVDVDFMVGSSEGYRKLREAIRENEGLQGVAAQGQRIELLRDVRTDQYGVRTFASIDGVPLKIEFVHEARIKVVGAPSPLMGVPVLSREDMYAEKLLANDDRQGDIQSMYRDIIDLGMMVEKWGSIPTAAVEKAMGAYGQAIISSFAKATEKLSSDRPLMLECLSKMKMADDLADRIPALLQAELLRLQPERERIAPPPPADELIAASPDLQQFLATTSRSVQQGNYESGQYAGRILWGNDKCCVQDLGRNTVVIHPTEHWHASPPVGTYVKVKYQHTIADWKAVDRDSDRSHTR